eukprot:TRINITY_DN12341_c1_g1_i1.p1 TRINITY_DN12341_c1_g1~~TRINITY_DN12341_c1_g1_i1.p1  ORF type:complete len:132 (-),score=10.71 TRINITY_DN12341_c1_g1_i1:323-718(-)
MLFQQYSDYLFSFPNFIFSFPFLFFFFFSFILVLFPRKKENEKTTGNESERQGSVKTDLSLDFFFETTKENRKAKNRYDGRACEKNKKGEQGPGSSSVARLSFQQMSALVIFKIHDRMQREPTASYYWQSK